MYSVYRINNKAGNPIYVGVSTNVKLRSRQHAARFGPFCKIVTVASFELKYDAEELESQLIKKYLKDGFKMVNIHKVIGHKTSFTLMISTEVVKTIGNKEQVHELMFNAVMLAYKKKLKNIF